MDVLVKKLNEAEGKFFSDPRDFHSLEKAVKTSTEAFAADFPGKVLMDMDEKICQSSQREGRYSIQIEVTLREIRAEHYDQAKSYIDHLQAYIPGITAKKSAAIRTQLRLI